MQEKELRPFADKIIKSIYGDYLLVLEEFRLPNSPLKPDVVYVFRGFPYVVLVELEVDADNPYCINQCFAYSFHGLTFVVCDRVSRQTLQKYEKIGVGVAVRDKVLLLPRFVHAIDRTAYITRSLILQKLSNTKRRRLNTGQMSLLDFM